MSNNRVRHNDLPIFLSQLTPWRYSPWRAFAYQPAAGLRVTHVLRHGGEPSSNQ
ncbi:hypothetical protein C0J52_26418 [Blattella germanica]|nr:hypothetical protein C0J52_26418 [Blattella germanica]